MKTTLVPVEVSVVRTPDRRDQMVSKISLSHLMSGEPVMADVDHKLSMFTEEYLTTLSKCKEELNQIEEEKRGKRGGVNPLHFWRIGDFLLSYLGGQPHQDFFVLRDPYGHFARDLLISKTTLQKAVTFRRRFESPEAIDTTKCWDYYRDAKYLKNGTKKIVGKTPSPKTQDIVVTVKFTVPADTDIQRLKMQMDRWFCCQDDSSVFSSWLEGWKMKVKDCEISIVINEAQPKDENWHI
jgi:hypothetical protein